MARLSAGIPMDKRQVEGTQREEERTNQISIHSEGQEEEKGKERGCGHRYESDSSQSAGGIEQSNIADKYNETKIEQSTTSSKTADSTATSGTYDSKTAKTSSATEKRTFTATAYTVPRSATECTTAECAKNHGKTVTVVFSAVFFVSKDSKQHNQ